jgi:hypothetical protein
MSREWILAVVMAILSTYALAQGTGLQNSQPRSGLLSGEPRSGLQSGEPRSGFRGAEPRASVGGDAAFRTQRGVFGTEVPNSPDQPNRGGTVGR